MKSNRVAAVAFIHQLLLIHAMTPRPTGQQKNGWHFEADEKKFKRHLLTFEWTLWGIFKMQLRHLLIKNLIFIENVAGGTCQMEMQT